MSGQSVTFKLSADQAIPDNSNTFVGWDSNSGNAGLLSSWDSSSKTWTVASGQDGIYAISFDAVFAGQASGARQAEVVVNGQPAAAWFLPLTGSAEFCGFVASLTQSLAVGDTVQFRVKQKSGSALNLRSAQSVAYLTRHT